MFFLDDAGHGPWEGEEERAWEGEFGVERSGEFANACLKN